MKHVKDKPKRFRVVPQEQGTTLRNLVVKRVGGLDRERAATLIRAGGVYVNRLRVRLPQVLVAAGERVSVYLEALDAEPLAPERVVFIHRDDDFVILDKPAGVPVSPIRETAVGCLSEALIHTLEAEGISRPYVGVVHRLDRGASGLVLFTIRGVANKSLHKQFRDHEIRRGYRIRARSESGQAPPAKFSCDAPLIKLRDGGQQANVELQENYKVAIIEPIGVCRRRVGCRGASFFRRSLECMRILYAMPFLSWTTLGIAEEFGIRLPVSWC